MFLSESAAHTAPVPPCVVFEREDAPGGGAARAAGVVAFRRRSMREDVRAAAFPADSAHHAVGIVLRRTNLRLSAKGRVLHDGIALPGLIFVTGPADSLDCQFNGPHDMLHIEIANALVAQAARSLSDRDASFGAARVFHDPVVERLAQALTASSETPSGCGPLHDDCIGVAIVTRIMAAQASPRGARAARASALVKWRLKRTLDFIEANLAQSIGLSEIAAAAGLTRMHFASQFRAATGLRPHEYLLRRRIERAQEMLLAPHVAVVEVALEVGFQTQAHFTSVFRRFVGEPPHAWRQGRRAQHDAPCQPETGRALRTDGGYDSNDICSNPGALPGSARRLNDAS